MRPNRAASRIETEARFVLTRGVRFFIIAMLSLTPLLGTYVAPAAAQESDVPSGNVIVVMHDQVSLAETNDLAEEAEASVSFGTVLNGFAANLTQAEADALADDPSVAGVYPDLPAYLAETPTSSFGVRRIGAESSFQDLDLGLPATVNATVAVIDSGVSMSHPNLNVVGGFDAWGAGDSTTGVTNCSSLTPAEKAVFEDDGANTWGSTSNAAHGSNVAGIIGSNGIGGVTGVAPGVNIVAIRAFNGSSTTAKMICAFDWLHANKNRFGGIDVANLSITWMVTVGACDSDAAHIAICTVVGGGLPIVAANGNVGTPPTGPMNAYPELIAVSSINDYDGRPGGNATARPSGCNSNEAHSADDHFSAYNLVGGSDYMAPGTCIRTTTISGYGFNSGTSFAAPHVAGAIALYAASIPSPSDAAARAHLNGVSVTANHADGIVAGNAEGARMLRLGPSPVFGEITPTSGAPSAKVSYTLIGFPSNATVTITWEKAAGGTIALGNVQTDSGGEATGEITVPDTAPGGPGQTITFAAGQFVKSFTFETRPRIRFHEPTATHGSTVLTNGRGFAANDTLTVRWKNGAGQFITIGTVTTNSNGNFSNHPLTVPTWAPNGANTVRMEGVLNQNTSSLTVITPGVQISPIRTTVNNKIDYDLSNFPPDTQVAITWTRLSGGTIDMGTVQTDEAGNASGQITVPATPGGPGQVITFAGGGASATAVFEVAPRIKSNTDPGQRGGQVDISLRGFAKQENFIIRWKNPASGAWITLGSGTTSNTGSANIMITVPLFAPDGDNSVRAESASFNQQTNVVNINGGAAFNPAGEASTPTPTPTPEPEVEETPATIDTSALPLTAPITIATITDEAFTPGLRTPLTDGQIATGWSAAPDPIRGDTRLEIDLGGAYQLSGLGWLTESGGCGRLTGVEYSTDGETWLAVDPNLVPGAIGEGYVWRFFAANVEAAQLRLTFGQPDGETLTALGCLAEIAVWGTPVTIETPTPEPSAVPDEPTPTPDPAEAAPAGETETPTGDESG